jgi:predicted site-specific integrase-resolvase
MKKYTDWLIYKNGGEKMNTASAAKALVISTATLLRWIGQEKVKDVHKNRNGHRVFTEEDIKEISKYRDMLTPPQN